MPSRVAIASIPMATPRCSSRDPAAFLGHAPALQWRVAHHRRPEGPILPPIAICIPACNEAAELPALFAAFDCLDTPREGLVHVCLLLDGCTDASASLAAGYRARSRHRVWLDQAAQSSANAGRARHRAMSIGLGTPAADGGLLLTTDADSVPARDWLLASAAALEQAEVVAGRIVRRGDRPCHLQDRVEAYYDALFALRRRLDPVTWEAAATHHHGGGANIGCRADAYRALGGFAPLASGEDARLLDDAARAGLRVRRDAASVVHTSDRRQGRAAAGLATALRHLDEGDAAAVQVTHPQDAAWQYRMQAAARASHAGDRLDIAATALGLSHDHVLGVARDCPNAEAFAMRIVPAAPGGMRSVALPVAEAALAHLAGARRAA